jgi:hypothetical protein
MHLHNVGYSWDASVQIFANDDPARGRIAGAAGAHILLNTVLNEAGNALLDYAPIPAIILHLTNADADQAGKLLDGLEANAQSGRCKTIVLFPPSMIDMVTAHLFHKDIVLLCDAEEHDIQQAIEAVAYRRSRLLCDITAEAAGTLRLQQLSEEVERMGRALLALSAQSQVRSKRFSFRAASAAGPAAELNASFIRMLIRMRRLRDQYFRSELSPIRRGICCSICWPPGSRRGRLQSQAFVSPPPFRRPWPYAGSAL